MNDIFNTEKKDDGELKMNVFTPPTQEPAVNATATAPVDKKNGAEYYRSSVPKLFYAAYGYNDGTASGAGVDQKNSVLTQPPQLTITRSSAGVYVVTHNLGTLAYYLAITCPVAYTVTNRGVNSFQVNTSASDQIFSFIVFCTP